MLPSHFYLSDFCIIIESFCNKFSAKIGVLVFFPNLLRLCFGSNRTLQDNIMITRWLCQPSSWASFMYSCCLEYNLMRGGRSQWRSLGTVLFCKDWHRCWMSQNCRCRNQATTVCPPPCTLTHFMINVMLFSGRFPFYHQVSRSAAPPSKPPLHYPGNTVHNFILISQLD